MTDPRTLLNRWSDAGLNWGDSSLRQIANLAPRRSPSLWPLVSTFAAGLIVGAVGAYALTRRSRISDFFSGGYETLDEFAEIEASEPSFTSHRPNRSNNRRKAETEVSHS